MTSQDLINKLKEYILNYDKSKNYFKQILSKRTIAVKNSKKLWMHHENNGTALLSTESNPLTEVFKLVEFIQEVIARNKRN